MESGMDFITQGDAKMLVYITRPIVHECIMGGFRSLSLWTKVPHYHHYPRRLSSSKENINEYVDRGWGDGHRSACAPAKPLLEQDEELAEKVWNQITWSCCPKGISFEEHIAWCNTPVLEYNNLPLASYTNLEDLLYHRPEGKLADVKSNINYKRFLLEVNLRTNEVKILTPYVHWYDGHDESLFSGINKTEQTLDIPERYATELPYNLHDYKSL